MRLAGDTTGLYFVFTPDASVVDTVITEPLGGNPNSAANVLPPTSGPAAGYIPVIERADTPSPVAAGDGTWKVDPLKNRIEFTTRVPDAALTAGALLITYFAYTGPTAASGAGEAPKNAVRARSINLPQDANPGDVNDSGDLITTGAGFGKTITPTSATTALTVETVVLVDGDRVLVDNSVALGATVAGAPTVDYAPGPPPTGGVQGSIDNGIYVFTANVGGKWQLRRALAFDNSPAANEAVVGTYTFVTEGPWAGYGFYVSASGAIDVATLKFSTMTSPGGSSVADTDTITSSGGTLTISADGDVNVSPNAAGNVNLITATGTGSVVVQGDSPTITTAAGKDLTLSTSGGGVATVSAGSATVGGDVVIAATGVDQPNRDRLDARQRDRRGRNNHRLGGKRHGRRSVARHDRQRVLGDPHVGRDGGYYRERHWWFSWECHAGVN